MKNQTPRLANTNSERRVGLKDLEVPELNLDKVFLSRFAASGKPDPSDRQLHPLAENTETTVCRLLTQVGDLLADLREPRGPGARPLALQGLALLGEDLLELVRENTSSLGGAS